MFDVAQKHPIIKTEIAQMQDLASLSGKSSLQTLEPQVSRNPATGTGINPRSNQSQPSSQSIYIWNKLIRHLYDEHVHPGKLLTLRIIEEFEKEGGAWGLMADVVDAWRLVQPVDDGDGIGVYQF